jgi:hypothetical protein
MSNTAKDVFLIVSLDNKKLGIGISSDKSWKVVVILENYRTTSTLGGRFEVVVAADDKSDVAAVVLLVEID